LLPINIDHIVLKWEAVLVDLPGDFADPGGLFSISSKAVRLHPRLGDSLLFPIAPQFLP
jgi:hypothetical protein